MIALRRLIGPGLLLGAAAGLVAFGWYAGGANENRKHQAYLREQAQITAAYQAAARLREQSLQANADQIKKASDEKINQLNRRVNTLAGQLRNRPDRPTDDVPSGTGIAFAGCTGAQLYRPDSEFLVRLFADAGRTLEALNQCRAAYNSLREPPEEQ